MRAPSNMYDIGIYSFPFEIFRVGTSFVACREIKKATRGTDDQSDSLAARLAWR